MSAHSEKPHYISFTLWDLEREFQSAREAYAQCTVKQKRRRSLLDLLWKRSKDDELSKALKLGSHVQKVMEKGRQEFGSKFEEGDTKCHSVLEAQLLRLQHEINIPLLDCAYSSPSSMTSPLPRDHILTAAKGIRRTCFLALRAQYIRLQSCIAVPVLPPPRFSVAFCRFALELRQNLEPVFLTKKVRPHDRHDDREICPCCNVQIAVTAHSGLLQYRRMLFQSHIPKTDSRSDGDDMATFACSSCYKTFDDSYAFLEHMVHKERNGEGSCMRKDSGTAIGAGTYNWRWSVNTGSLSLESDTQLVEKCLKNCLKRESMRASAGTINVREIRS